MGERESQFAAQWDEEARETADKNEEKVRQKNSSAIDHPYDHENKHPPILKPLSLLSSQGGSTVTIASGCGTSTIRGASCSVKGTN